MKYCWQLVDLQMHREVLGLSGFLEYTYGVAEEYV